MREAERAFVLEGAKVISEALRAGVTLESIYVAHGHEGDTELIDRALASGARVRPLAPGVIEKATSTVTPQALVAVAPYVDVPLVDLEGASSVLVGVDLRDPGNAGTVLRSAEAAGVGAVILCAGSVDLFNPKCVRASAGAIFHVPVVRGGDARDVLAELKGWGLRCLGAVAHGGDPYDRVDWNRPVAVVLGNEAHGLPGDLGAMLDEEVTIPISGRAESINVGMAAAVLTFEMARQRRAA